MKNPYTNTGALGGARGGGNNNGNGNGQNRPNRNNPGQNKKKGKNTIDPVGMTGDQYMNSDAGNEDINTNHNDYFQVLMGQQMPAYSSGNPSPFNQWLQREGFNMMENDYASARLNAGGDLNYKEFADAYRPGQGYVKPVDTGNAFTSSSGSEGSSFNQQPTIPFRGHGAGGGRDKHRQQQNGGMEHFPTIQAPPAAAAPAAAPTAAGAPQWGAYFRSLTPEQRGEYMSGYSMGPSRWSVYG